MFPLRQSYNPPHLPEGYVLDSQKVPSSEALNRLLSKCREKTHAPGKLALAINKSVCHLSIFEEATGTLAGFVRATTDYGLNANLWNLVAEPGKNQRIFFAVLIHQVLGILRRNAPGCSIAVSAPEVAIEALQDYGFLLDPNGIRAMGNRLR